MPVDLRCIRIKGRAGPYDNLNRDELIDQYIQYLDHEERLDLLYYLMRDSTEDCYSPEWLRNVLEDIDRENAE